MKPNKTAAMFVEHTSNAKLGNMSTTYVSIDGSCSNTCQWKDKICYAQTSFVGIINSRLNKRAKGKSSYEISRQEAKAIDASFNSTYDLSGQILRLHTSGDCRTRKGALTLASAAKRWNKRNGGPIFTYTHSWRTIPRKLFGTISVLASVDDHKDISKAYREGYAPAIVVSDFPNGDKAFEINGHKFIACPNQTRDIKCSQCRLCFDDKKLFERKTGIAFKIHGTRKSKFSLNIVK